MRTVRYGMESDDEPELDLPGRGFCCAGCVANPLRAAEVEAAAQEQLRQARTLRDLGSQAPTEEVVAARLRSPAPLHVDGSPGRGAAACVSPRTSRALVTEYRRLKWIAETEAGE